ncbi:Glycosyltransferase involved in cell wall bisynthesis [Mariniphaga anaerophila]|uniref:Glycosyltransferase involved in cell wall bisynthesis n=1 Tax=Mariniphaga anaerophila TaxID=1484053 RepID=A0A1M5CNR7_9BACT|nr:glycosyltransferase family 1 protein [Mariniphaga anaerophila]SHF56062.1 Glycosyltransferase involved in cell wall bisynthesis [Mariniphaga anaerophila]
MKIGFDAKRAFLNSSGLGNYSRNTLNALHSFFAENEYVLFTPEVKSNLFDNYQRFKVVSPQSQLAKKMKSLWRSLFLVPHLKKHEVDLFHGLSNELPKGIHTSGIPSVVTIHDLIFMRYPEFYKAIDCKIYFKKVKYACHAADRIIAISKQTKHDIETFFHIPSEKIELIYQPVAPAFFEEKNTSEVLKKYHLPERFILAVGTLERRKNQQALLQAVYSAKIKTPVVFVGKQTSSYMTGISQIIKENEMDDQVKFLNNVPEPDLAALYQSALFSVYISVFEGFGLPVIESMASGCPVITSSVSVLPETAGDAALLCDPANIEEIAEKLLMLETNEQLRTTLKQKGIRRAEEFHPENYAKKLTSLYTKILTETNA